MNSKLNYLSVFALFVAASMQASEYVYSPISPSAGNIEINSTYWLVDGSETPQMANPAGSANSVVFSQASIDANGGNAVNIWTSASNFELAGIKVSASTGSINLYNFSGDSETPANSWFLSNANIEGGANLTVKNWPGKGDSANNLASLSIDNLNISAGSFSALKVRDIQIGVISEIASQASLTLQAKRNLQIDSNISNSGKLNLTADTFSLNELVNKSDTTALTSTSSGNVEKLSIIDGTVNVNNSTGTFHIVEASMQGGTMGLNASGGGYTSFDKLTVKAGPIYISNSALVDGRANVRLGELNMSGGFVIISRDNVEKSYVEIGGLNGTGGQITTWNNNGEGTNALVIFNSDGGTYNATGVKLADNFQTNGATSVLSLEKNGSSRQVLSYTQNSISGDVNVKNGTLLLNNTAKLSNVNIEAGMFGSAGQKLQISSLNLNGGKLLFDFSLAQNESSLGIALDSASGLSGLSSQSDFVFAEIDTNLRYLLISFADSSVSSALQDIASSDSNGKFLFTDANTSESFYATFTAEDGAFYVSFSAVPEPASFASILGFASLFFAYRRKL